MEHLHDLRAITFSGFYESLWDSMMDNDEEECKRDLKETYPDVDEDMLCDLCLSHSWYRAARNMVARDYIVWYLRDINAYLGLDMELVEDSEEIDSPSEYNFTTDKLFFKVRCGMDAKALARKLDAFVRADKDREEYIRKTVKDDHSSRDGFWSWMSNDYDEWPEEIADGSEIYLSYLVGYLMLYEWCGDWTCGGEQVRIDASEYENVAYEYISCNLGFPEMEWDTDYVDQEEWQAFLAYKEDLDWRRGLDRNTPQIPGIFENMLTTTIGA